MDVEKIMSQLEQKHPGEPEYLQAVREVLVSVSDVYNILRLIKIPQAEIHRVFCLVIPLIKEAGLQFFCRPAFVLFLVIIPNN